MDRPERELLVSGAFKRDLKRLRSRGLDLAKLQTVIVLLRRDEPLPPRARPHRLCREWESAWECHVAPDWLLIYDYEGSKLALIRTGTHADLFG